MCASGTSRDQISHLDGELAGAILQTDVAEAQVPLVGHEIDAWRVTTSEVVAGVRKARYALRQFMRVRDPLEVLYEVRDGEKESAFPLLID